MTSDNSNIRKKLQGNSVWRVSFVAAFFVCLSTMAISQSAKAALVFEVSRLDNSNAQIMGTGSIDVAGSFKVIRLVSATSVGDSGDDAFVGDFAIGGVAPGSVFTTVGTEHFDMIYALSPRGLGDSPTGLMTVTLNVGERLAAYRRPAGPK